METLNLSVKKLGFLLFHVKVCFERLCIESQGFVLLNQLFVEGLLEIEVSTHVGHFSIPEV